MQWIKEDFGLSDFGVCRNGNFRREPDINFVCKVKMSQRSMHAKQNIYEAAVCAANQSKNIQT